MVVVEDVCEIVDDVARFERVAVVENEFGRIGCVKGVDVFGVDVGGEGGDV